MMGPSFRKNGCCHGLAVVPGPLVLEYSWEIASAFLYTEVKKRFLQIHFEHYHLYHHLLVKTGLLRLPVGKSDSQSV